MQLVPPFIDETTAQAVAAMGATADVPLAESKRLDLSAPDRAGPMLEIINWQLAHPRGAVPAALLAEQRTWTVRHGRAGDGD